MYVSKIELLKRKDTPDGKNTEHVFVCIQIIIQIINIILNE